MQIKKAAVLGAGVMGAQIAAHLANAGIPCLLLDIAPKELTPDEQAKGLTLESRAVRNRIAQAGFDAAQKAKPAAFFVGDAAKLVTVGNFEDDLPKLKDCDWVLEAIVERLDIKRTLYERIEPHLNPEAIITSNTSGIPLASLADVALDAGRSVVLAASGGTLQTSASAGLAVPGVVGGFAGGQGQTFQLPGGAGGTAGGRVATEVGVTDKDIRLPRGG